MKAHSLDVQAISFVQWGQSTSCRGRVGGGVSVFVHVCACAQGEPKAYERLKTERCMASASGRDRDAIRVRTPGQSAVPLILSLVSLLRCPCKVRVRRVCHNAFGISIIKNVVLQDFLYQFSHNENELYVTLLKCTYSRFHVNVEVRR